jgi:hypothetical protein
MARAAPKHPLTEINKKSETYPATEGFISDISNSEDNSLRRAE